MAFIQKTTAPISFQGGLQSKTDAFQVQPPAMLALTNAKFDKIGQLNKRFGYDILTTNIMGGGTINSSFAIGGFNNELNLFDNQNIYTYIAANGTWANRGPAISLINSNKQIIRNTAAQQLNPDSAYLNGIEVFVWEDSRSGVRFSVVDSQTEAFIKDDQLVYVAGAKPKVIVFNGLFFIIYTDGNNNIFYRTINPSNPNVITSQINITADGLPGDCFFDACVANGLLFIAYSSLTAGLNQIRLLSINPDQTINPSVSIETNVGTNIMAVNTVGDSLSHLWVSWSDGYSVKAAAKTAVASPAVVLATTLVDSVICPALTGIESTNTGALQLTYEIVNINPSNQQVKSVIIQTSGTLTAVGAIRSVGLASKAFRYQNNLFVNLTHQSTQQSTYFMVFLTNAPFTIVGKVSPQVGGGLTTNGMLGEVSSLASGIFLWSNLVKGRFTSEDNVSFSILGVNATKVDFTNTNKFNLETQSNNLLFVGGILQSYDGVSVAEQNFHIFPEDVIAVPAGNDGSLSTGQYQYQVVYAWSDKFGQIQYSTPSVPVTVTVIANNHVTITVPTLRLSAKVGVIIKIYRTAVNGVVFQEVTDELIPLENDPTVDSVTFVDFASDNDIAANAPIYTNGGVLSNSAPPSCSLISLYQDRVMLSGLEDPNLIWFSKNKVDNSNFNTIPVEFSANLTIAVSQVGGAITALGLMDDKLIIFKKNAIFILTGDGPNDLGGGDQFASPELISSSIGCTNPNSVILMKDGIMFQSDKGIWILPRSGGEPQYIGAGVDDQARSQTVSSACIDPNDNLVIFTTYEGNALVYDYYNQQWVEWTNHQSVDGIAFNGLFTFCKANGQVYMQNRNKFTDGSDKIILSFTIPWLSLAGMQGYQSIFRCFLLGTFKGPHQLFVEVGYDFDPAFTRSATIDATTLAGTNLWGSDGYWGESTPWGGVFQPYQFQINFNRQKCTSFRMRVSDSQTSPYNEGYAISSLSFEVGMMPDNNRLPAVNKVGAQ